MGDNGPQGMSFQGARHLAGSLGGHLPGAHQRGHSDCNADGRSAGVVHGWEVLGRSSVVGCPVFLLLA